MITDVWEKTGKDTGDLPPQGSSQPSMDIGNEGKRFDQALSADRAFIRRFPQQSFLVCYRARESLMVPPGTKRSAGELDGPGDWW